MCVCVSVCEFSLFVLLLEFVFVGCAYVCVCVQSVLTLKVVRIMCNSVCYWVGAGGESRMRDALLSLHMQGAQRCKNQPNKTVRTIANNKWGEGSPDN